MATLTSQTIAGTYKDLLKINASSYQTGVDGTLRAVEDGDATASALQISTVGICVSDPTTSSATEGALLRLQSNDSAAVTGSGHRLGIIEFSGEEDASDTMVAGAQIYAIADAAFTATGTYDHATRLEFAVQSGTSGTDTLATPAMTIDSSGLMGIGTVAPQGELEVCKDNGSPSLILTTHNDSHGVGNGMGAVSFAAANANETHHQVGAKIQALGTEVHDDDDFGTELVFYTSDNQNSTLTARMTIDEDGLVGIGTAAPQKALDISAAENNDAVLRIDAGSAGHDAILEFGTSDFAQTFVKTAIVAEGLGSTHRAKLHFVVDGTADTNAYTLSTDTKMVIQHDGKVGIGTDAPNHVLHVNHATTDCYIKIDANTNDNAGLHFAEEGSNMWSIFNESDGHASGDNALVIKDDGNERMCIEQGTGNVGIGTNDPSTKLHVVDTSSLKYQNNSLILTRAGGHLLTLLNASTTIAGDNALGYVRFEGNENGAGQVASASIEAYADGAWGGNSDCPSRLRFLTTPASSAIAVERMRIDKDGKVGIGTPAVPPIGNLTVSIDTATAVSVTECPRISFYNNTSGHLVNNDFLGRLTFGAREDSAAGTDRIGAYITAIADNTWTGNPETSATRLQFHTEDVSGSFVVDTPRMTITSTGTVIMAAYADGTCSFSGGTGLLATSSDERLKENVSTLPGGLSLANKLNPVYFTWKEKEPSGVDNPMYVKDAPNSGRHLGFIAQEVGKIIPEASPDHGKDDEQWRGIQDRSIIAVLTKAVQELSAKVTALENA